MMMFLTLIAGLGLIAGRLYWMQIVASSHFVALAADQRERKISLSPQRGSILDRDGAELAISVQMKTIYAHPQLIVDPRSTSKAVAPVLGIDEDELTTKLASDSSFVYLARKIEPSKADAVSRLRLPGIGSVPESRRLYPSGDLGSHVVGFVGSDNEGLGGVESQYEALLRGSPGEIVVERDPQGSLIPAGKSHLQPAIPGDDLVLSIDREIQYATQTALAKAVERYQAKSGSAVVMDPRTGDIYAMANHPTFDPNNLEQTKPEDRKNRAILDVYEPGSANKVITAAAAIESGIVSPGDMFSVPYELRVADRDFHDAERHPTLNLSFSEIIQRSSNTGTIKVALELGKEKLHDYLVKFGYGQPSGTDFPGETNGILPDPKRWFGSSIGAIPIGHGVAVTMTQVMRVFATLANGGVAPVPRLVVGTIDADGRRHEAPVKKAPRAVLESTADQVTSILVGVTGAEEGTGRAASIEGYQVAGKTGTSQKVRPDGKGYSGFNASFFGYAPAGDPRLVVGVVLEDPKPIYGGLTAAPTFKEIMQFGLRHLGIGPGPVLLTEGTPLPAPARSGGEPASLAARAQGKVTNEHNELTRSRADPGRPRARQISQRAS